MHLSVIIQQMNVKSIQRKKFIKINKQKEKNQDQVSWNFFPKKRLYIRTFSFEFMFIFG